MPNKWTKSQEQAISSKPGTVLVSAAAGSGKTSVLVERVIRKITNKSNPIDIDKFLIVTFTKAAATEMKERISARLTELISQNPKDINLYRQQMLLKSAQIGTIDSFCNTFVKENFYRLEISPNFKIANESEISMLKEKALQNTFDYFYSLNDENFKKLLDIFGSEKSLDLLFDAIKNIDIFLNSSAFPEKWCEKSINLYDENSKKENVWFSVILDYCKDAVDFSICVLTDCLNTINEFDDLKKTYLETFENDILNIEDLKASFDTKNYDIIFKKINDFSFLRLKPCKTKENTIYKDEVVLKREYVKKIIKNIKKYYIYTPKQNIQDKKDLSSILKTLFEVTFYFRKEFYKLKNLRNILDFNDLERFTLKLLIKDIDPLTKTDIAKELSEKYIEVMVDEYQDINEVQDIIFKLVTKDESNLFMVGDVKQSIYKFRQSRPQIFLNKKNSFSIYDEKNLNFPCKIILDKNFRSKKSVIDAVNAIFECLMSKKVGDMDYAQEEKLSYAASYDLEDSKKDVSVYFVENQALEEDNDVLQSRQIARIILQTISEGYQVKKCDKYRNATFSDFCILIRNANSHAHIYAKTLNELGIPSFCEAKDKFLETIEISNMFSILKVIDNPINDIQLIATMMSAMFGFKIEEINEIRQLTKEGAFYFALKNYAEKSERVKNFIEKIDKYRQLSTIMSCSELIDYIYQDTQYPYMCLAMASGNLKKANLFLFKDYAEKFDQDSSKGLGSFLEYLENLKQKNSDLPSAAISSEIENTVKIMSIHKSKGLEFPICIIADLSRKFVVDSDNIVFHPELGSCLKLKNDSGMVKKSNMIFDAICLKNKNEDISEEMRVFYVAVTRAKQKIVMIGALKDVDLKKMSEKCTLMKNFKNISSFMVQCSNNFLDWILICICFSNLKSKLFDIFEIPYSLQEPSYLNNLNWDLNFIKYEDLKIDSSPKDKIISENTNYEKVSYDENIVKKIEHITEYVYPFEESSKLPIKIAASKLSHSGQWQEYFASSKPDFMYDKSISATDRGTAMHNFMCMANFKNLSDYGIESEIERLLKNEILSSEQIKLLNKKAILDFVNSDLFKRISKSPKVLREYRFSIKIPIKENSKNLVVVQGAMDCAFVENNEFIIVDYKTDKEDNIQNIYEKYISQLKIYKYALEQIQDLKVKEIGIYSFYLSKYYF